MADIASPLEILSELRGHRRHNVNGRVIRWCSGTPLLADDGQDIIADARPTRLLAVLILAAVGSAVAQENAIDPTPPGSLNPKPLPPLQIRTRRRRRPKNCSRAIDAVSRAAASIGGYFDGCLAGAVSPITGPTWHVMRPSRNRNWGNPQLVRFIERLSKNAKKVGWNGLLVGDMSQPRGGPMPPATPAIKSASTSIFGLRRCLTTCKTARSASSTRPPMWSRSICSTSIRKCGPAGITSHPHRCAGSGGHPHLSECRDQEGAVPRGRS